MAASPRLDREARDRPRLRRGPAAFQLLFVFVCIGLCYAPASQAQQRFDIRSAYVERAEGVYQLTATLDFDIGEGARAAVRDGAPFTLHLEIVVRRQRSYWLDEGVAALEQSYELVYHALSDRYLVRNVDSGTQETFQTLEAALERVGTVDEWPIAVDSQLERDEEWQISLRAGVRRGHMPDALRALVFWSDAWHRTSDWYTWTLVR